MGSLLSASVLGALERGCVVLTANQRAARVVRRAYDRDRHSSGRLQWSPPAVFSFDTWLDTLWQTLLLTGADTRLLLNRLQEHSLWQTIIAADKEVSGLRSPDALADLAAGAWTLLHRHGGRPRLRQFLASTDARAFDRWCQQFERVCQRGSLLSAAQLPATLAAAVAQGTVTPPAGLLLLDFDRHPPAHAAFLAALETAGCSLQTLQSSAVPSFASRITADDDLAEMRHAARWAANHLARNPEASVALVVPDLADRSPQLTRIFSQIVGEDAFEFSLGHPLADTPAGASALDLLRWSMEPLGLECVSALLLSPVFASATSSLALAAAEFDAFELRTASLLRPEVALGSMISFMARSRRAPRLTSILQQLRAMHRVAAAEQMVSAQPGVEGPRQSHAGWADAFRNLLEASGWTSATLAGSASYQMHRTWESALDSLATLDFDGALVSAPTALNTLTRIARQTIFAPESRNAPIQILGPLEPGGASFDALWFLGADDLGWPQTPAPNPLLSWHLQRELGVSGTDPALDDAIARQLTTRLAHAATDVIFSFARRHQDGQRRPSPLLRELDLTPAEPIPEPSPRPLPLQIFADTEPVPPLPPGTLSRGGARILELQAACSFRAFAEFRLHSTQPDSRSLGLDARDRGIQVHSIMQDLWVRVQSQQNLKALPRSERNLILDACIEDAIVKLHTPQTPWESAYLDVQRRRLRQLLDPWLDFEAARAPFTVRQQELKEFAQIGPLHLELRVDRIDDTPAGAFILDYKTGDAQPGQWLGERMDAPQLPLYAVHTASSGSEALAGVAFALLRAGDDLDLRGFADDPSLLAKPARMEAATFPEQVEQWHHSLVALAEAFVQNDPIADPKLYPRTCERCGQRMFCRLNPLVLASSLEEHDDREPADG